MIARDKIAPRGFFSAFLLTEPKTPRRWATLIIASTRALERL